MRRQLFVLEVVERIVRGDDVVIIVVILVVLLVVVARRVELRTRDVERRLERHVVVDDDGRDVSCPLRDGMGWERDDFYVVLKKESPHRTTKEEAKVVVVPRMNSGAGLSFGAVSLDKKNGVKE